MKRAKEEKIRLPAPWPSVFRKTSVLHTKLPRVRNCRIFSWRQWSWGVCTTLLFYNNSVALARAEYSYFSSDFMLKIFLSSHGRLQEKYPVGSSITDATSDYPSYNNFDGDEVISSQAADNKAWYSCRNVVSIGHTTNAVFYGLVKTIDQFRYIKNSALNNRPQYEALGNKYRVCGVYSPEPRSEVYFLRLNFNISKLVYCIDKLSTQIRSLLQNLIFGFMVIKIFKKFRKF